MARKTTQWILAAIAACAAAPAMAAGNGNSVQGTAATGAAAAGPAAKADLSFVREAAVGGMTEVQLGKLAQQKAASDEVRQFGARMVEDHTKVNEQLKQIGSMKQIDMPQSLDAKHQNLVAKLEKLNGSAFDQAYMKDMVADHRKDVADFSKAASFLKDPDLMAFAGNTLPVLQQHLRMAESTANAVTKK